MNRKDQIACVSWILPDCRAHRLLHTKMRMRTDAIHTCRVLLEHRPSARLLAQSCKRQICHTLPSTEEAFLATFCTFSTRGQLVSARSARLWNQMRSTGAWYRPICCLVIVRCLPEMSCSQQAMRACAQCLELGGKPIMIPADRNQTRAECWEFEREGTGEAVWWGITGRVDGKPDIMASGKPVKVEINTLSAHRIVHRLDL